MRPASRSRASRGESPPGSRDSRASLCAGGNVHLETYSARGRTPKVPDSCEVNRAQGFAAVTLARSTARFRLHALVVTSLVF